MMNITERVSSIEAIATIIADVTATAVWSVEGEKLLLRVVAGPKKWAISAVAEPRDAAEDLCSNYLLRKMAHAAGLCPQCRATVRRAAPNANNQPRAKRYRCPSCMHSWTDS